MIVIGLPFVLLMLIPVILIETWIFKKETGEKIRTSWKDIAAANVISTIAGYPLAWLLQFVVQLGLMLFIPTVIGDKVPQINNPVLQSLSFIFGAAWLMPVESQFWWMIPCAGMVSLVPAYFISVFIEFKVIQRRSPRNFSATKRAVSRANIGSYFFLIFLMLSILGYNYVKLDPRVQPLLNMGARIFEKDGSYTIRFSRVSDLAAQIEYASKIPNVKSLSFRSIHADHKNFLKLTEFPEVEDIDLAETLILDEDLTALKNLNFLREIDLENTSVKGHGFSALQSMPSVVTLVLSGSLITDEEMKYLKVFPNLEDLFLINTRITGRGMRNLYDFKKIKRLGLQNTSIKIEDINALQKYLPAASILR